ncbi:putative V-type ATP synthase subunit E [Desulfosarcina variabilis str. Montpellier]|uniref:V-type ATP synthase subunit E n=1 Tax=Desulfosarcina variabilis TaxID=2300 RepID=UPI003AFAC45F
MPIWGHVALLCRAIADEGRQDAEQILTKARQDAAEVITAARDAADKAYQQEIRSAKSKAYADAKQRVDHAELEARRAIMAFRERIIQTVLDTLDQRLQDFRKAPDYAAFLRLALKEGIDHLPGNQFIVEVNDTEVDLLHGEIEKQMGEESLQIEVKAAPDCNGGLRITTRDRRLRYDNSFAARRQRSENDIRREIWSVIFGTESTPT